MLGRDLKTGELVYIPTPEEAADAEAMAALEVVPEPEPAIVAPVVEDEPKAEEPA